MTEQSAEPGAELDTRPETPALPLSTYDGTSSVRYEDLWNEAAVVEGYTLTDKATLIGVPFIIIGITFRYGGLFADRRPRDYVSVEAVTKDNAPIVFNDGSTGIRRQLVQYLGSVGLLPNGNVEDPDTVIVGVEGMTHAAHMTEGMRPLACPRGLRVSEYENEYTKEGETYYLA